MLKWTRVADLALADVRLRYPEAERALAERAGVAPAALRSAGFQVVLPSADTADAHRSRKAIFARHAFDIPHPVAAEHLERHVGWGIRASVGGVDAVVTPGDGLDDFLPAPDEAVSAARASLRYWFLAALASEWMAGLLDGEGAAQATAHRLDTRTLLACDTSRAMLSLLRYRDDPRAPALERLMARAGIDTLGA